MGKRRTFGALLAGTALGLAAAVSGAADPSEIPAPRWRTFVSEEGRFRVELPAGPVVAKDDRTSPMGTVVGRIYTARLGELLLVVEARDLPALASTLVPGDTILETTRHELAADVDGVEVQGGEVRCQGFRARDFVYRLPGARPVYERALVVLAGSRLYVVTGRAAGPPGSNAALERFFGSFRLWSDADEASSVPAAPDASG